MSQNGEVVDLFEKYPFPSSHITYLRIKSFITYHIDVLEVVSVRMQIISKNIVCDTNDFSLLITDANKMFTWMLQPVRKIINVTNGESFIFKFKLTPNPTVHCMKITNDL